MLFRDINCSKLTDTQIKLFIKNYNSNILYKRNSNGKLERYGLVKQMNLFYFNMKKKDKTRVWRSNGTISCNDYLYNELTEEEYGILVLIFRKYKFQSFVDDPCVNFHRVRVQRYELTLQKDVVGRIKLMFKIINY